MIGLSSWPTIALTPVAPCFWPDAIQPAGHDRDGCTRHRVIRRKHDFGFKVIMPVRHGCQEDKSAFPANGAKISCRYELSGGVPQDLTGYIEYLEQIRRMSSTMFSAYLRRSLTFINLDRCFSQNTN